jgi:hypothetical protein
MKSFVGTTLIGAAGLLALSLSAHAAGSTSVTGPAAIKFAQSTQYMQLARLENISGGGYYKKSKKKKKKKTSS